MPPAHQMTGEQMVEALARLNLRQVDFARVIGAEKGTVSRWARGVQAVPGSVAVLLRTWLASPDPPPIEVP